MIACGNKSCSEEVENAESLLDISNIKTESPRRLLSHSSWAINRFQARRYDYLGSGAASQGNVSIFPIANGNYWKLHKTG